ncbi:PREDICTED: magnesium transporter NIPA2 [Nicrophorus vespilloides]|uniref:Magnesium transporter NIPA2 n=1 Tax=Nicrophorus vespilloides TaxID=110193 RepID=A0ABM1MLX2_NICVS|nr:PREDICTED: magnesium transporter NIPA2 [Nicrophorus vespilloides]
MNMQGFSSTISTEPGLSRNNEFYFGLVLAISSTAFIGSSFVIKKIGLIRLNRRGALRAGSGGFGYLRDWIWWLGLITMGAGELANFAAYAFSPASLVTPLGALSVLVSAILASKYLNENLNLLGKLGCVLCILGSTVIVIHSPKEETVESLDVLMERLRTSGFVVYCVIIVSLSFVISFYLGPKYGDQNVLIYIALCSGIGSLTVVSCKGLGLALKQFFAGVEDSNGWLMYLFFITVVICIIIQMNYLNKALDLFDASVVTPVYYVFFTTLVIIASSIVFNEWSSLEGEDILGNLCGFLIVIIAIFMLNGFKDGLPPRHKSDENLRSDRYQGYQSILTRSI